MRRLMSIVMLAAALFAQTSQPSTQSPPQQQQKSQPKCSDNGTYVKQQG